MSRLAGLEEHGMLEFYISRDHDRHADLCASFKTKVRWPLFAFNVRKDGKTSPGIL
jgi:hypothetical protein